VRGEWKGGKGENGEGRKDREVGVIAPCLSEAESPLAFVIDYRW